MISSLLIMNAKGDVVISRQYRGDVSVTAAEAFRLKIVAAKETGELLLYLLQLQTIIRTKKRSLCWAR